MSPTAQQSTKKLSAITFDDAAPATKLSNRGIHILRHTFCSHLARKGAPARAIQELAGHVDLMTQRYMHLSPAALERAIKLLESARLGDSGDAADQKPGFRGAALVRWIQ